MSHSHTDSTSSSTTAMTSNMSSMIFHNTFTDSLFSSSWMPTTTGQYAGTCIFLILLGAGFRLLNAYTCFLERQWVARNRDRKIVIAGRLQGLGSPTKAEEQRGPGKEGVDGSGVGERRGTVKPWRWSEDLPRAALVVVYAAVGYLLMFAIMTGNVGYFLSVLGGIFLGELVGGRYAHP